MININTRKQILLPAYEKNKYIRDNESIAGHEKYNVRVFTPHADTMNNVFISLNFIVERTFVDLFILETL